MGHPCQSIMHPSFLLALITLFASSPSVRGSGISTNKRVNRLRSFVSDASGEVAAAGDLVKAVVVNDSVSKVDRVDIPVIPLENTADTVINLIPLEERRVQVFHGIYALYQKALGRYASPGIIEWSRVSVANWPENISKSDVSAWSEEDVEFLQVLLDSYSIGFGLTTRKQKNPAEPLILGGVSGVAVTRRVTDNVSSDVVTTAKTAEGIKKRGRPSKKITTLPQVNDEEKEVESESYAEPDFSSSSSDNESLKSITSSDSSESEDADSSFAVDSEESKLPSKTLKASEIAHAKPLKTETNFKNVKVFSDKPADSQKRQVLLNKVLDIYRKDSRNGTADKIDWGLLKVNYLQHFIIPFSTGLRTEGDLLTLENTMKLGKFHFYNMNLITNRRERLYERLYRLYFEAVGPDANNFFVKWNEVNVTGWPTGTPFSNSSWSAQQIVQMESLLDADEIKFEAKKGRSIKLSSSDIADDLVEAKNVEDTVITAPSVLVPATPVIITSTTTKVPKRGNGKRLIKPKNFDSDAEWYESMPTTAKKAKIEAAKPVGKIIPVDTVISAVQFGYEGETEENIKGIKSALTAIIEETELTRQKFITSPRHQQIFVEILKGLDLMFKHSMRDETEQRMSVAECISFLDSFESALKAIDPTGDMSYNDFKSFVINRTEFDARLAGIAY